MSKNAKVDNEIMFIYYNTNQPYVDTLKGELSLKKLQKIIGKNLTFFATTEFIVVYNENQDELLPEQDNITLSDVLDMLRRDTYINNKVKLCLGDFEYKHIKGNVIFQRYFNFDVMPALYDFVFSNEYFVEKKLKEFNLSYVLDDINKNKSLLLKDDGTFKLISPKCDDKYSYEEISNYLNGIPLRKGVEGDIEMWGISDKTPNMYEEHKFNYNVYTIMCCLCWKHRNEIRVDDVVFLGNFIISKKLNIKGFSKSNNTNISLN